MLDLITKSSIRKKILLLLIYNPARSYYLREIARLVGSSAGNIRQELKKLEEKDLVLKEKKGNLLYFRINTKNSLLTDLKNIVDKTIGIKKILEEEFKKIAGVNFAFLFGSYVKGNFKSDSDIDLYVIGGINEETLYQAIKKAEEKIYHEINYHLSSKEEFQKAVKKSFFHQDILKNFILVYGQPDKFKELLN